MTEDETIEIIRLIKEFSNENDLKVQQIEEEIKKLKGILYDIDQKLSIGHDINKDMTSSFSPNTDKVNIIEMELDRNILQKKISKAVNEIEYLSFRKLQIDKSINLIEDSEQKLSDMSFSILNSNEQDRQRIARDMHDSTVQNLTGLVHKIELCSRLVDMDPIRAKLELMTMSGTVKMVINEVREIIFNLKPMSLEDLGFIATIERFLKQIKQNNDIEVNLTYNHDIVDLLPVMNLALYRVVQEACHNVIKHAKATRIDINIQYSEDTLFISIKDNGDGFDMKNNYTNKGHCISGYGLSIMKERVYLLSGSIEVHSEIKKGTKITITVPLMKCKGEENDQTN